jgi:hypothetical protein
MKLPGVSNGESAMMHEPNPSPRRPRRVRRHLSSSDGEEAVQDVPQRARNDALGVATWPIRELPLAPAEDDDDARRFELQVFTATGRELIVSGVLSIVVSVAKSQHMMVTIEPEDQYDLKAFYEAILRKANQVLPFEKNPDPGYHRFNRFLIFEYVEEEPRVMLDTASMKLILSECHAAGVMVVSFPKQLTNKLVGQRKPKVPVEVANILLTWGKDEETMGPRPRGPAALLREGQRARDQRLTEVYHAGDQLRTGGPGAASTAQLTAVTGVAMQQQATGQNLMQEQTMIPVFSEYTNFFVSLNAAMYTIDQMLEVRGRTAFTNRDAVREIIYEVIRASSVELGRREDFVDIIHVILEGAIPRERVEAADSVWQT